MSFSIIKQYKMNKKPKRKSFSVKRMLLMAETFIQINPSSAKHIYKFVSFMHQNRDKEL